MVKIKNKKIISLTFLLVMIMGLFIVPKITLAKFTSISTGTATLTNLNSSQPIVNFIGYAYGTNNTKIGTAFFFKKSASNPGSDCNKDIKSGNDDNWSTGWTKDNSLTVSESGPPFYATATLETNQTYYYCAGGRNGDHKEYGAVLSLSTTPTSGTPTVDDFVKTTSPSNISEVDANNAKFSMNGALKMLPLFFDHIYVYFKYKISDTQPDNCSSGTGWTETQRATATSINFTSELTIPKEKMYYYCAATSEDPLPGSGIGIGGNIKNHYGNLKYFGAFNSGNIDGDVTPGNTDIPEFTSIDTTHEHEVNTSTIVTGKTDEEATISGSAIVKPRFESVTPIYGYFRYSPVSPGSVSPIFCNQVFGDNMKSTKEVQISNENTIIGSNRESFTTPIANLQPSTTYYFCAIVSNKKIIEYGPMALFTTAPDLYSGNPLNDIETKPATAVASISARMNGSYNTAVPASTWFEYRKKVTYQDIRDAIIAEGVQGLFRSVSSIANDLANPSTINTASSARTISTANYSLGSISNTATVNTNTGSIASIPLSQGPTLTGAGIASNTQTPSSWKKVNTQNHLSGTSGPMSFSLSGLEKNKTYEFRAGIQTNINTSGTQSRTNTSGVSETFYGNILSFRTSSSTITDCSLPANINSSECAPPIEPITVVNPFNPFGGGGGGNNGGSQGPFILNQIITPPNLAVVGWHEGVETVFQRQIVADTNLAKTYGYVEGTDLQSFAWTLADYFGKLFGYVNSNTGKEIRVSYPDIAAYQLSLEGYTLKVYEYYAGKITGIQSTNSILKNTFFYEYYFNKR